MQIVICPGIHPAALTRCFVQALPDLLSEALIVPAHLPAYSGVHILEFIQQQLYPPGEQSYTLKVASAKAIQTPILLIGFSAGVVGGLTAAYLWQRLGGVVVAFIAVDGWGVPLLSSFPVHRLSHDAFTHWSSALLGAGQANFYAEPSVAHLDLWCTPQFAEGWSVEPGGYQKMNAAQFLRHCLHRYLSTHRIHDSEH